MQEMEWSDDANDALCKAKDEARNRGEDVVNSGHLLLGLLNSDNIVSTFIGRMLREQGKELADLRKKIDAELFRGDPIAIEVKISSSRSSELVCTFAANEAERLKLFEIGCEHILLGIFVESSFPASILRSFRITQQRCRRELKVMLML